MFGQTKLRTLGATAYSCPRNAREAYFLNISLPILLYLRAEKMYVYIYCYIKT